MLTHSGTVANAIALYFEPRVHSHSLTSSRISESLPSHAPSATKTPVSARANRAKRLWNGAMLVLARPCAAEPGSANAPMQIRPHVLRTCREERRAPQIRFHLHLR